jgi:hypothetical protein
MKILRLIIQFKRSSVDTEIDTYKEFLYDLNNLANSEKEKLNKMVKEMVDRNPKDEQDIYDHYSDQYDVYDTKYVELANNGTLVNAYSFFEHQLKDICRTLKKFMVNKKGTYRHQGNLSYAENLRNEIIAITGLDFSSLTGQWTTLDKYRKVRNVIVHNGANLFEEEGKPLTDQKNYGLVSSFGQIKINADNGDFYIIDKELVADYLDLVDDYLKKFLDIIKLLDNNDIR